MKHADAFLSRGLLLSLSVCTAENPSEWDCSSCEGFEHFVETFDGDALISTSRMITERDPAIGCTPGAGCVMITETIETTREGVSGSLTDSATSRNLKSTRVAEVCLLCSEEN